MIRYTKQSRHDLYAVTKTDELCVRPNFVSATRLLVNNMPSEWDDIDKDEFLAFIREHHDSDTVAFVEAWIAKREVKPLYGRVAGVDFRFRDDGHLNMETLNWSVGFSTHSQRQIVELLTENLRRHGQEVGT